MSPAQGREFDMVAIFKDQESLVTNHLPYCECPEVPRSSKMFVQNPMGITSERSQRSF